MLYSILLFDASLPWQAILPHTQEGICQGRQAMLRQEILSYDNGLFLFP